MDPIWNWAAFLLLILCTAGTFLPILPGLPLMAVIITGYGWLEGFINIRPWIIILSLVFALLAILLDYMAGPYLAKRAGASRAGFWGALLGGVIGIFILGPLGLVLGPFLGALAGEVIWGKNLKDASKTGMYSVVGLIIGNMFKLLMAIVLTAIFFIKVML